jgi:type VI secretion system protein ImpB
MDIDGDGLPVRELPFVMGVMSDLTGDQEDVKTLEDRKFIDIDRDNINEVMERLKPKLEFKVDNVLSEEETEFLVELGFKSMEDFEPGRIVEQVPMLKKLLEMRNQLDELSNVIDKTKGADKLLESILQDAAKLADLGGQVGAESQDTASDGE